jgi:hypothetical protein
MTATVRYIDVDTTKADAALDQLERHAASTTISVVQTARRGLASLNILADLAGYVIPQWFNLMVGAVFMMVNTMRGIGTALAAASPVSPLFAIQASFAFLSASMMFASGFALIQGQTAAQTETAKIMAMLNTWSI